MKHIYLIVITFLISGCVTGNYQSYSSGVGYQSEQQDGDAYHVTYTGSEKSKIEKVNDFALLRSAELTLEKGFNYFVITEATNNKNMLANLAYAEIPGNGLRLTQAGRRLSGPKPKSELTILLFHDKPEGITYDARVIEKALKEEYKTP